ncbi:cyclin-B2-4-like isoform X2 [Prosopis cineraria]|uniref:cyclin-B2-4-like isoform X2 n=1 Tax=Prosopis cineraria TaxID=364024 RepID=UPI00240FB038|nr:cyclin-B2-4-like isoform X2 [Prosopis cineraria]
MGGSKETQYRLGSLMPSSNLQGGSRMDGIKLMKEMTQNNRRALSNINQNIMEATHKPCVVNRRDPSGRYTEQTVQHCPEETKKRSLLAPNPSYQLDGDITDIEEYEGAGDNGVPVFVRHTEAMLDEIERLNSSCVSPDYMAGQFDINEKMRAILVDWLIEVHYKFELMEETLYLTVNLIDRFLERQAVIRKKLQLVGVTAMLIACKYEEVSVPTVEDFILITDKAYKREEVLNMEKLMMNTLQFSLCVPTPYVFMRRFLKAAQSDKKLELLSSFIIELCLVEYKMLRFSPSLLAAAAIYTAQCSLYQYKQWTKTSDWYTNYSEDQLLECSRMMVTFHHKAGTGKLTGVYRKYTTCKYGYAANMKPALFLLDSD